MFCCPPWKKKKSKTYSTVGSQNTACEDSDPKDTDESPSHTDRDRETDHVGAVVTPHIEKEPTGIEDTGEELSKTQENHGLLTHSSHTLKVPSTRPRPSLKRQPASKTSTQDGGYATEESSTNLVDGSPVHRTRVYSSVSDISNSSYHTAVGGTIHERSVTSSALPMKDPVPPLQSLKDDLFQSMKEVLDASMIKLEKKLESNHQRLAERIDEVEKQMKEQVERKQNAVWTGDREEFLSTAQLHAVGEVKLPYN